MTIIAVIIISLTSLLSHNPHIIDSTSVCLAGSFGKHMDSLSLFNLCLSCVLSTHTVYSVIYSHAIASQPPHLAGAVQYVRRLA